MRNLVIAAVLASAIAAPAAAQVAGGPFTGFRLEALAGYDNLRPGDAGGQDVEGIDGFQYGGAVGYDIQLGSLVVGAEAELGDSTGSSRTDVAFGADRFDTRLRTGRDVYVGARVGFPVDIGTMIYAKGGYANARVHTDLTSGTRTISDRYTVDGFRLGAGAETLISANSYAKLEYRYTNYSSLNFRGDGFSNSTGIDLDRHQVVAGVGVRF